MRVRLDLSRKGRGEECGLITHFKSNWVLLRVLDEFSASARMNHYEKGRHTPDYSTLKRIAVALKVPVAYFYAESEELALLILKFSRLKKVEQLTILKQL